MNGHENYDERASNETKQKKISKKWTNFQYNSWVLELGQWDAWLSLGCGMGEILVFFPLFFLCCVSAGIPFVQLVLMEMFFHCNFKVFSFLFVFSFLLSPSASQYQEPEQPI